MPDLAMERADRTRTAPPDDAPTCLRCGFRVTARPWGCKHPCGNCGFIYPLGDCSD